MGSAGPYTGTILLSTESPNPPAPPYRGKPASKKKEKKETVKINEQRPLLETPTRQEMTRGTKMVSTDLCQEPRCQLSPLAFFFQHSFNPSIDLYICFCLQAAAYNGLHQEINTIKV